MSEAAETPIETNLTDLRGEKSVQEVADAAGITRGNLYNLENGAYFPTRKTADALSRVFDRPIIFKIEPSKKLS